MGAVQHVVFDQATGKTRRDRLGDSFSLIPWNAALTNRHNARANIVILGDSYIEGYPVALWKNTIGGWLQTLMQQRFPVVDMTTGAAVSYGNARGFVGVPSTAYATTAPTNTAGAYGWTFTGGSNDDTSGYGAKYSVRLMSASGNKAILAVPSGGLTSFDLQHIVGTAGSSTGGYYAIDGGSHVPFSTLAGATAVTTTHIALPVNTTLEVGWNGGNGVILSGVVEYGGNENSGIAVHQCGIGGAKASTWLTHPTAGWPQAILALNPHVLIVQLGGNEYLQNIASATYQTNLAALVALIRAAGITCPIILSFTVETTAATAEPHQNYVTAARNVVSADPTMRMVEHAPRAPKASDTVSPTYNMYFTDGAHGNVNGNLYSLFAHTLMTSLSPQHS